MTEVISESDKKEGIPMQTEDVKEINDGDDEPYIYHSDDIEDEEQANFEFQSQEEPDYPISSEEISKTENIKTDYDIKTCWNDVILMASKNSLMGFDKIISSTKKVFVENGVEMYFSEESYYNLAKECKFDENISNAFLEILKRSVSVRFLYSPADDTKNKRQDDSNFDELFSKLGGQ